MYVYTKDTVVSHIDTVAIKENTYIKGQSGFDIHSIRNNITTLKVYFELLSAPSTYIALQPLVILSYF